MYIFSVNSGSFVVMYVYMTTIYRNVIFCCKIAATCALLCKSIHKIGSANKSIFISGEFSTDLKSETAPLSQILLPSLPSGVFWLSNQCRFLLCTIMFHLRSEFHQNRRSKDNGYHFDVSCGILTSGHSSMQCWFTYSLPLHVQKSGDLCKYTIFL